MKMKHALTGSFKVKLSHCLSGMVMVLAQTTGAAQPPLLDAPSSETVLYQMTEADRLLTPSLQLETPFSALQEMASSDPAVLQNFVEARLDAVRISGDTRVLGQALQVLQNVPSSQLTTDLRRLRATVYQSLHAFEPALQDLHAVLEQTPQDAEALLLLSTIHLAQGHYAQARRSCQRLWRGMPMLISASCGAIVQARIGQAEQAYRSLLSLYKRSEPGQMDARVAHFALVSLAEMAEQLGKAEAFDWWQAALERLPDDLYTRIGYASEAWHQGHLETVLQVTENSEDIDALQLLRWQALSRLARYQEASEVLASLGARLELAHARKDVLHARDQAAILLFALKQPEQALQRAQLNWAEQKEPADTRLLMQAAISAQRQDVYDTTREWLAQNQQHHADYPQWSELP